MNIYPKSFVLLGASGFIGRGLVDYTKSNGGTIYATDRHGRYDLLRLCRGDGSHTDEVKAFDEVRALRLPVVCAAGNGVPAECERDVEHARQNEKEVIDKLLDVCLAVGSQHLIYLSSAGTVYGEGRPVELPRPFRETDECLPLSAYGFVKLWAENYLRSESSRLAPKTKLTILRVTNVYGPTFKKDQRQSVISVLLRRILGREPITIYGSGEAVRDYLYISDLASAIRQVIELQCEGIYNIGSGVAVNTNLIVSIIESVAGVHAVQVHEPARAFDVRYSAVDISRAINLVSWQPKVSLEAGIRLLYEASLK